MTEETEREHEIVLGNKQLLSGFFVVVALLGAFFVMGYVVGKNTVVAGGSGSAAAPATASPRTSEQAPAAAPAVETASPDSTVAEGAAPVAGVGAESSQKPSPEPSPAVSTGNPENQHYLQLMAVKKPDAENIVKVLRERGFPAVIRPSSKEELFRVLVGPYDERAALSKARDDLKAAGFDSIITK